MREDIPLWPRFPSQLNAWNAGRGQDPCFPLSSLIPSVPSLHPSLPPGRQVWSGAVLRLHREGAGDSILRQPGDAELRHQVSSRPSRQGQLARPRAQSQAQLWVEEEVRGGGPWVGGKVPRAEPLSVGPCGLRGGDPAPAPSGWDVLDTHLRVPSCTCLVGGGAQDNTRHTEQVPVTCAATVIKARPSRLKGRLTCRTQAWSLWPQSRLSVKRM